MAIPQACGERIITPSITACPPTRVSSPLSRAGSSCRAARKRRNSREYFIGVLDDREPKKRSLEVKCRKRLPNQNFTGFRVKKKRAVLRYRNGNRQRRAGPWVAKHRQDEPQKGVNWRGRGRRHSFSR